MGENFKKLKNRALKIRLIKSALVGLSASLLIAGVLVLLSRLTVIGMAPIFSLPIGIGVFLAGGTLTYFLLNTSDLSLAKRLDKQYNLNEKIQTMLVYENDTSALSQLQREDANDVLSQIKNKWLDTKKLWIYILCASLGAIMLIASFIVPPPKEEKPVVEEKPFQVTELQILALNELAIYVDSSAMQDPYKSNISSSIRVLVDELKLATTISERDRALKKSTDEIFEQTSQSSSALELMTELWKTEDSVARLLAKALNYYDWPKADEQDRYTENLEKLRAELIFKQSQTTASVDDSEEKTEPTDEEKIAYMALLLSNGATNIKDALLKSNLNEADPLYVAVLRFAEAQEENKDIGTHVYGLLTISIISEALTYKDLQREIDVTFTALNGVIFTALTQHSQNTGTGEYALSRISNLFNYQIPAFERPSLYDFTGDGAGPSGDGTITGGGIGNGTIYGSDDLVYDPFSNTYVEYGVILDRYYAIMFGKTQGEEYTEEEKEAMEKYFNILYGGFKEENQ